MGSSMVCVSGRDISKSLDILMIMSNHDSRIENLPKY